jgi:hypothetical protein
VQGKCSTVGGAPPRVSLVRSTRQPAHQRLVRSVHTIEVETGFGVRI